MTSTGQGSYEPDNVMVGSIDQRSQPDSVLQRKSRLARSTKHDAPSRGVAGTEKNILERRGPSIQFMTEL